jgi:alanine dehydrogenase
VIIGVPREIKTNENRIALVPAGCELLVGKGHEVYVEKSAGVGSGFSDEQFVAAGAKILDSPEAVWKQAELIMKVKEPIEPEWPRMRRGQVIYTYFHFAAAEDLTRAVIGAGCIAIAYETVQLPSGELPLLTPMSEVAGRMAVQEGAKYLEKVHGGRGVLLGGVPGVPPAKVVIIGGGVVGMHAGDLISEIGLAIEMGCDAVDIGKTIHPHPTLSESIGMAAEVFEGVCTDLPPARKT